MPSNRVRFSSVNLLQFILLVSSLVWASGCQTARMAVPADLEMNAEVFPCSGRQGFVWTEKFTFGPYAVTDVSRGWTRRFAWGVGEFEQSNTKQAYEFRMTAPGGAIWAGQAATGVKKNDLKGMVLGGELTWGLSHALNFVIRIGKDQAKPLWSLIMGQGSRDKLIKGALTDGATTYTVEGTDRLEGSPMPLMEASGYLISKNGRFVAAVEVINEGSVRFAAGLPAEERDLLATAASGLLLFKDISKR